MNSKISCFTVHTRNFIIVPLCSTIICAHNTTCLSPSPCTSRFASFMLTMGFALGSTIIQLRSFVTVARLNQAVFPASHNENQLVKITAVKRKSFAHKKTPVETGAVPKLTAYELATNIMEKPISFQLQKNKNLDNLWLYSKKAIFLPRLLPLLLQLPSISKTAFSIIIFLTLPHMQPMQARLFLLSSVFVCACIRCISLATKTACHPEPVEGRSLVIIALLFSEKFPRKKNGFLLFCCNPAY